MKLLDLAQQQEFAIPGARLVAFYEKDFPVYRMELAIRVRGKRGMSLLAQFVLRLIKEEFHEETDLADFFGVPLGELRKCLGELSALSYIIEVPTLTGRIYKINPKGLEALELDRIVTTREEIFTVKLDAISGKWHHLHSIGSYALRADSGNTLRPYVPAPTLYEVSQHFSELKELYKDYKNRYQQNEKTELDDIVGIPGNVYTEYQRLRLLVYRTEEGKFIFQVFDRHHYAPEYSGPLAQMAESGVEIWEMTELPASIRDELPLPHQSGTTEPNEEEKALKELWTAFDVPKLEDRPEVNGAVYPLTTTEHFAKMQEALENAEHTVYIVSPWVSNEVIDELFPVMKSFLRRGGHLWIGYGYPHDEEYKGKRTEKAVKQLKEKLASNRFHAVRLGDTHEKILICDDKFAIVGSYNWLSFRGDRKRGFVAETSLYVGIRDVVLQLVERVRRRFDKKEGGSQ